MLCDRNFQKFGEACFYGIFFIHSYNSENFERMLIFSIIINERIYIVYSTLPSISEFFIIFTTFFLIGMKIIDKGIKFTFLKISLYMSIFHFLCLNQFRFIYFHATCGYSQVCNCCIMLITWNIA